MHTLDRKPKSCADGLQCLAFGIVVTNQVVARPFGNMFFSDGLLREWDAQIETIKQPIGGSIQGG